MKTIKTTLTTTAIYSDDKAKRYLLRKVWDDTKPKLAIVMISPSEASGIELDNTTMLVLNNASRLGYGGVSIVNLFATLGDLSIGYAEDKDKENLKHINEVANEADVIVYASGVGRATNKSFIKRQNQVLEVLKSYEGKLKCLSNKEGKARFQHPLSPAVRTWYLSDMRVDELYSIETVKVGNDNLNKKAKTQSK